MALLQNVIQRGLLSARPAAGSAGVLYFATDVGQLFRDNGSIWQLDDTTLLYTAKGQLLAASASGTVGALAAGTNGQVLTSDSTQTLGVKWAASSGGLTKLDEVIVGVGGQATISFSSINQGYRSLQLSIVARNDGANNEQNGYIQFNGDTGANYESVQIQGYNNAVASGYAIAQNQWYFGQICGANASANKASHFMIDIPNYTGTVFYKSMSSRGQNRTGFTSFAAEQIHSGAWNSTAAITSILFSLAAGNFVQGSVCSLYGVV